jgi:hypothetical protein
MPTHFDYDVSYHCKARLRVGSVAAIVHRIEQSLTYSGLLEGTPTASMNDRKLDPVRRAAASRGAFLVEPARRDFLRMPGDMDEVKARFAHLGVPWIPEWLPMIKVEMTLHGPGDDVEHYSTLHVFFFQDDFAPPVDDRVAAALRDLDWTEHAAHHEI